MHHNNKEYKEYFGLHIAAVGLSMVALGTALYLKEKKKEENCCCH